MLVRISLLTALSILFLVTSTCISLPPRIIVKVTVVLASPRTKSEISVAVFPATSCPLTPAIISPTCKPASIAGVSW